VRIVFRADASPTIGTGHIYRSASLARALKDRGAEISLICHRDTGPTQNVFAELGADIAVVADLSPAATLGALKANRPDWMVVDHYQLGADWHRAIRSSIGSIFVIDDLMDRPLDADAILNQNLIPDAASRYAPLVPTPCQMLLGSRYTLLHPEYRSRGPRLRDKIERVLVFFGGFDHQNVTGMALEALSVLGLAHLDVDIVIGADHPAHNRVSAQAVTRGRTTLHTSLPHLADVMSRADLAIGAGGTTTWERMSLGLPSIVVSIADNQTRIAEALAEQDLQVYAGLSGDVTANEIADHVVALASNPRRLASMSERSAAAVDGFGAERIAEYLIPSEHSSIELRQATSGDIRYLFGLTNDPSIRAQSKTTDPISWATHKAWFNSVINNPQKRMSILTCSGIAVGQIRFDVLSEGVARVSCSVDTIVRGRGLGTDIMVRGIEDLSAVGDWIVDAEIRAENIASIKMCEAAGFRLSGEVAPGLNRYTIDTSQLRKST
jgi:UDP-2,4-diacetamido-2,4,6-trideoxy-beta-L-altropyranose hydrolase